MLERKNQLIVILLFVTLFAGGAAAGATAEEIEQALRAYRAGDIEAALGTLETAAASGDAGAQYILGAVYLEDHGVSPDPLVSTRWYRAAAEQGHFDAQFSLGNAYLHGRGVGVDLDAARLWWHRAARAGSAEACVNLAVDHIQRAEARARGELGRAWLQKAIELGSTQALVYLGMLDRSSSGPAAGRGRSQDLGRHQSRDWGLEPIRSEARLLVADPETYTLQLLSATSREAAQSFIERYSIGDRALLFRLPKDKQLLWNVVYGDYRSKPEALETIEMMRTELRQAGPWPRSLREIQAMVRTVWTKQEGIAVGLLP